MKTKIEHVEHIGMVRRETLRHLAAVSAGPVGLILEITNWDYEGHSVEI